jgi:TonB-linked SusC/RagA family outer membrane protein
MRRCAQLNPTVFLLPLFFLFTFFQATAQEGTGKKVTGKVTDATGSPVPGATIVVKGTDVRTIAKEDGSFTITVATGNETLVVSSVGFESKELELNNRSAVTIGLASSKSTLEDVVVVGYGSARKRDITGAVATFNPKGIEEKPIARVDQALIGQMPGVQIKQQTGMPGAGFSVQVRGAGSITAGNEPLYVIDGFPLDVVSQNTAGGFSGNPLNNINPNDIESIQVLKDAAAGAIYGSRASNGVVIITTKKGQIGKARITVNGYAGISKAAKKLDVLSPEEWIAQATELANAKWVALGGGRTATQTTDERRAILGLQAGQFNYQYMIDDRWYQPGHPGLKYINWQDEAFRTAPFQNYEVSASGGTDNVRYFFSGNYLNQSGVLINSGYKNYSARGNVEVNANKRLKLGFNLAPTYSETNAPSAEGKDNQLMKLFNMTPIVEDTAGINTGAGKNSVYGWASSSVSPVAYLNHSTNITKNTRILFSTYAEYQILNGLSAKTTINYDESNSNTKKYVSDYVGGSVANYLNSPGKSASGSYTGFKKQNFVNENTLNYNKTLGEHTINAVGGMSYSFVHQESFTLSSSGGYNNNAVTTLGNAVGITGNTSETNNVLLSYYARAQYSYGGKYLLTASVRRDASSRFGANNRWGTFPSVSLGWRISDESFMKGISFLDDLKLRVSYGKAGNYAIGDYSTQALLTAAYYSFGGSTSSAAVATGQIPKAIPNPNLKWEMSNTYNVGFDASFLRSRINVVFDAYQKKSTDLLLNVPVVAPAGFTTALQNIGSVINRGVELAINSTNISQHDFQWTSNFNISFNKNKVAALGVDGASINVSSAYGGNPPFLLQIGLPMYSYYLIKTDGILTAKDIADPNVAKLDKQTVGDTKFVDYNGDHVIDARDRQVVGQPNPKFNFGLTNNFRYKDLDLSIMMYGQTGGYIYSFLGRAIDNFSNARNTTLGIWRDRWTETNQNYNAPRGKISGLYTTPQFTTDWLYSSNFLRIQNITLGYNLKKYLKAGFISNARVYASVQNWFGWDKYKGGVNPEAQNTNVSGNGSFPLPGDYGAMPLNKAMTVGVNVTF